MQTRTITGLLLTLFVIGSCKSPLKTSQDNSSSKRLELKIQAGGNVGGIIENTDIVNEPGAEVDAFSGATKTGFNLGARIAVPIKNNAVETGIDIMNSPQTFTYTDPEHGFHGERDLGLTQLMLPLTWNFGLINHPQHGRQLELKVGPVIQYNMLDVSDSGDRLPEYDLNRFSSGFSLGMAATPFVFKNGSRLGFYVEGYKGSQIYEDFYNQSGFKETGSSFAKFGITYQFKGSGFK
ncbi:hypothetical protein [Marinilabilia sp.]|uniref:hypothetical protein n=1 Tax=Marinilabilia sp. TaxID=2021252 RepID=UPI0025C12FB6|nr:hypothetical protein [Marinilabilia sp.]